MVTRLLLVDDHALVREGVAKLLSDHKEFEVVGETNNGFDAVTMARDLEVNVVIMDMYMPGIDGVSTTRLIKRDLPDVEVIMLTASDDDSDLLEAIQAGARGFVLKQADLKTLVEQLKQVLSGQVGMSADLTTKLVTGIAQRNARGVSSDADEVEPLTEREKDVLALISQGSTNKEIAGDLFISENTVRAHVRSLMQKLHRENRTQLAVYGVHHGYTIAGRAKTPTS